MNRILGSLLRHKYFSFISFIRPQFVVDLTQDLYQLLGIKLAATMAYHLRGDGHMERVNQEMEQYLWLFVKEQQNGWDELLSLTEFQYINHTHTPLLLGQPKQQVDVTQADDGDIQREKSKDPSSVRPSIYTCKWCNIG